MRPDEPTRPPGACCLSLPRRSRLRGDPAASSVSPGGGRPGFARRLKRPTPALQLVERQLRAHLESAAGAALALVEINAAEPAALAMAALARSLASEGKRVLSPTPPTAGLAALLGAPPTAGNRAHVSVDGLRSCRCSWPRTMLAQMADEDAGEDADSDPDPGDG